VETRGGRNPHLGLLNQPLIARLRFAAMLDRIELIPVPTG